MSLLDIKWKSAAFDVKKKRKNTRKKVVKEVCKCDPSTMQDLGDKRRTVFPVSGLNILFCHTHREFIKFDKRNKTKITE